MARSLRAGAPDREGTTVSGTRPKTSSSSTWRSMGSGEEPALRCWRASWRTPPSSIGGSPNTPRSGRSTNWRWSTATSCGSRCGSS
jgi:hypothetical protein